MQIIFFYKGLDSINLEFSVEISRLIFILFVLIESRSKKFFVLFCMLNKIICISMCIFINYRILYKTFDSNIHCMPYTIPCHESTIGNGFGFFFIVEDGNCILILFCNDFFFWIFRCYFLKPEDFLRDMLRCSYKLNLLYTPDHGLLVEKKIINFVLSFFNLKFLGTI